MCIAGEINSADTKSMRSFPSPIDWCAVEEISSVRTYTQISPVHYRLWKRSPIEQIRHRKKVVVPDLHPTG
jgi:hypothetical protein